MTAPVIGRTVKFGCTVQLDANAPKNLARALRRMTATIDKQIRDNPGVVVERRDHYLVVDGENGPGVWVRSHVRIVVEAKP